MKALLLALMLTPALVTAHAAAPARDADSHFFQASFLDLPEELQLAKAEGRSGLAIMFGAEDCSPCKRMKQGVLSHPRVQDYYREHFRVLYLDFNGDLEVISPAGGKTTEKQYAAAEARIRGTPSFLFLGLNGKELARQYGEQRSVEEFLWLGEFVASGAYRSSDFSKYRSERRAAAGR